MPDHYDDLRYAEYERQRQETIKSMSAQYGIPVERLQRLNSDELRRVRTLIQDDAIKAKLRGEG